MSNGMKVEHTLDICTFDPLYYNRYTHSMQADQRQRQLRPSLQNASQGSREPEGDTEALVEGIETRQ